MVARLRDWGMDIAGIQRDMQHPTGRVEISMAGKSHTFEILPDQAYDFIEAEAARCAVNLRQCGVLYHGSLALRGKSREALERLCEAADAPVFLDINLREPWWSKDAVLEMIKRASILKLNDDELKLLKPAGLEDCSAEASARKARTEWGVDALWLTLGKEGALYCSDATDALRIKPDERDAPVVDTVGAGDAFSAALMGGFLKGADPEATAECATRLATRICGQQGATVADRDVYRGLEAVTHEEEG
jgi:fructokinase